MTTTALSVFTQNDGEVTKRYYAELGAIGPLGQIAVALFRAQKRSAAAKRYRRGAHRGSAYDVKAWSMAEICRLLAAHPETGITYGWKQDAATRFGPDASWVLYCDLPQGQVSFHSPTRLDGPDYEGDWCGMHVSAERIIQFCDSVAREALCQKTP